MVSHVYVMNSFFLCFAMNEKFQVKAMNTFVLKDFGDPWHWLPAGSRQDYSAEEWDGEKNL